MRLVNFWIAFLVVLTLGQEAYGRTLLWSKSYQLRAARSYQTNFQLLADAPVRTNLISLTQSGSTYCNIKVEAVEYMPTTQSEPRQAVAVGSAASYRVPEGQIAAINIVFHQETWTRVDCTLSVYSEGDEPIPTDSLIGVVQYGGGYSTLSVDVSPWQVIQGITPKVPAFCRDVEIVSVGTVISNVFYPATPSGSSYYAVPPGYGNGASSVRVALNGPRGFGCDVPVYVRY